jgi:AraC-like DNA-binding protein
VGRQSYTPTVLSAFTRNIALELDGRGVPWRDLFAEAGVALEAVADVRGRIPYRVHAAVLSEAARRSGDPLLPVALGRRLSIGAFSVVGYCAASAPTLGDAFGVFARHFELLYQGFEPGIGRAGGDALVFAPRDRHAAMTGESAVVTVAAAIGLASQLTQADPGVARVLLPFERPAHAAALERELGVPVSFEVDRFEIGFRPGQFRTAVPHADPAVRAHFERLAFRELARLAEPGVASAVRRAIVGAAMPEKCTIDSAAAELRVAARTLQRRLHERGLTFAALKDDVCRELAEALLARSIPIDDVALHLGFSSRSAFHRAFRQWTGTTPARLRESKIAASG